jgi:hypothetical protein
MASRCAIELRMLARIPAMSGGTMDRQSAPDFFTVSTSI